MICEGCERDVVVTLVMDPGHATEGYVCVRCYEEGRKPMKLGRVKITVIADEKLGDALSAYAQRTGNLIEHPPDAATKPRKRKTG